jgi:adenylyltransferase/sulfurtransferase
MKEADRFERQVRFQPLGTAGQERLLRARVMVVGCGALGGHLAQTLARCGVGDLVLVDRDVVDWTNLPRQVLFEERHARGGESKVAAALETLGRIGGPTRLTGHAVHLDAGNIAELASGCDLILDGTDNVSTRYLINDHCVQNLLPWIYAGVVEAHGVCLPVLAGRGPCLRCLFPTPPAPGVLATCDSAGVLLPAVGAIASIQAGWALRLLVESAGLERDIELTRIDVWSGDLRSTPIARSSSCPCCVERRFEFLDAADSRSAVSLCGRKAVQVRGSSTPPDLARLAASLDGLAQGVRRAGELLRFHVDSLRVTVFGDGRALIEGTEDKDRARSIYDRYVGS